MYDHCGFFEMSIWVREDTILPVGAQDDRPDYDYAKDVTLCLFELKNGEHELTVPDIRGQAAERFTVVKDGDDIRVSARNGSPFTCLTDPDIRKTFLV